MDQAAYSFLVGTFGGAIGGIFAIAVAMWYVNTFRKENVKENNKIDNASYRCPFCNSNKIVKDEYGVFCTKCKKSITNENKQSTQPQEQIIQIAEKQMEQTSNSNIEEIPKEQEMQFQKVMVYACPFCNKELTSKQGLLLHVKKKHSPTITTINT